MADYVTVVEVDDPQSSKDTNPLLGNSTQPATALPADDSSFITVLSINNNTNTNSSNNTPHQQLTTNTSTTTSTNNHKNSCSSDPNPLAADDTEEVTVYRLVGERLGFGLKFQGGTRSAEKVQKLFIQSCAKDSPASKVVTSWGQLKEGDEIVKIDEHLVRDMTRIECVKCLKDNVAIKLVVRNGKGLIPEDLEEKGAMGDQHHQNNGVLGSGVSNGQMKGAPPPPPPVPPRKLVKKQRSFKDAEKVEVSQVKQEVVEMSAERSFTPPPDAEYYINLFAENNGTNGSLLRNPSRNGESESDDTASTISTVIDRYSMTSNYSSESDLSGFTSLNNGQTGVAGVVKPELAKVLKPFALLEQEFRVEGALENPLISEVIEVNLIPGNNYENVEFKTEKINNYENVELKAKVGTEEELVVETKQQSPIPTPKPRQQVATSPVEPKKRSIIPMPRKLSINGKQAIEVPPPKIPEDALRKGNGEQQNPNKTPTSPAAGKPAPESPPTKEFTTKIPKAIHSPSSQYRSLERAKTESEIKLKQEISKQDKLKQQTTDFLAHEASSNGPSKTNKTPSPVKSRIPIVLTPKRSLDLESATPEKKSTLQKSPTNIPRLLTKQKSETDLKLNYCRSKESSPTMTSKKIPLQRTISADSKIKMPERTLIPVLHPSNTSNGTSSTESLNSNSTTTSGGKSARGPKPKPPERVQSLNKTQIPKANAIGNSNNNNVTTVAVVDRSSTNSLASPQTSPLPAMQTFKQPSPPKQQEKPLTPPSPNREIRFKIQTYTSTNNNNPHNNTTFQEPEELPSLFELQRRNSPDATRKSEEFSTFKATSSPTVTTPTTTTPKMETKPELEDELDRITPPPLVVGKCMKVDDTAPMYYSSSSSDDEEENETDLSGVYGDDDDDKDYICEDGEKLGPPELINGPGPSEAYFNLYWHSNMLPTIGEVEEECSSLELQSMNANGPIVIVDDLSQQKPSGALKSVETEEKREPEPKSTTTKGNLKKPNFIGVPVLPPTVPNFEDLKSVKKSTKETNEETKIAAADMNAEPEENCNNLQNNDDKIIGNAEPIDDIQTKKVEDEEEVDKVMEKSDSKNEHNFVEVSKSSSKEVSEDNGRTSETSKEVKTEHQETTTKTGTETMTTTTTTKKIIKSSTTTSSSQIISGSTTHTGDFKTLDGLPEEFTKVVTDPQNLPEEFKKLLNSSSPKSPRDGADNKPLFTLQPYNERKGNTKITVLEERQFESNQKAYSEIRTKDALTGEEKVQKSSETHREKAKLKKVQSQDSLDDGSFGASSEQEPLTVTAKAETRLAEEAHNPQDNQSIARGILKLSECGKQVQTNALGGVDLMECEHQVMETFEDSEQILKPQGEKSGESSEKPSLLREISETLTVSKNGDTQVTKHNEITAETPAKKGPKLLKKSEEEKRLEMEAQKLIESYQKVRKEAEKLFQFDNFRHNDDDQGFDLSGLEVEEKEEENIAEPQNESVGENLEATKEVSEQKKPSEVVEKKSAAPEETSSKVEVKKSALEVKNPEAEVKKSAVDEGKQLESIKSPQEVITSGAEVKASEEIEAPKVNATSPEPKLEAKTSEPEVKAAKAEEGIKSESVKSPQEVLPSHPKVMTSEVKSESKVKSKNSEPEVKKPKAEEVFKSESIKSQKEVNPSGVNVMTSEVEVRTSEVEVMTSQPHENRSETEQKNKAEGEEHKPVSEHVKSKSEFMKTEVEVMKSVGEVMKSEGKVVNPEPKLMTTEVRRIEPEEKKSEAKIFEPEVKKNVSEENKSPAEPMKTEEEVMKKEPKVGTSKVMKPQIEVITSAEEVMKPELETTKSEVRKSVQEKIAEVEVKNAVLKSSEPTKKEKQLSEPKFSKEKEKEIATKSVKPDSFPAPLTREEPQIATKPETKPLEPSTSASEILSSPIIISPSASDDVLHEETEYVLHKNIIKEEGKVMEIIEIEEKKKSPKSAHKETSTKTIKISPKSSPRASPKLKRSEKTKTKAEGQEDTTTSLKVKPKPTPKPKPPIPQRRNSTDANAIKPIPKRRGSLETTASIVLPPKEVNLETTTTSTPIIEIPKPVEPITIEIPKPMERIIVGVEHHIIIPSVDLKKDLPPQPPVITLASDKLPSVVEKQQSFESKVPLLSQTASGDLLETINLPNVSNASSAADIAKEILVSSSMDSVQSVEEKLSPAAQTDEEELEETLQADEGEDIKARLEQEKKIE
ncbi:titin-like, partial [Musca vetustissima]|uniref:titin-like n=1 Tax=Musca vetustissima TaxID=27455 RepID=UPI002AB5FCBC